MGNEPPSKILSKFLIRDLVVGSHNDDVWPCFYGFMPDDDSVPDTLVTVYDLEGTTAGKLMRGNTVIDYPMVSIMLRATSYGDGFNKGNDIKDLVDSYRYDYMSVGGSYYAILNAKRSSGVVASGQAAGTRRRYLFTLTYALTLKGADDVGEFIEGAGELNDLVHNDLNL